MAEDRNSRDGEPLLDVPENDVAQLLTWPVGQRLRELRVRAGFKTQGLFLARMKEVAGDGAPKSVGWLSGVETGALPLTDETRGIVNRALHMPPHLLDLLASDQQEPPPAPGLVRYAAWQAMRTAVAEEMIRRGSQSERPRGRAVLSRLLETLEADNEIYVASGRKIDRLEQFGNLPTSVRWTLLVEGAFMDPFLPFVPFAGTPVDGAALEQFSEKLGLEIQPASIKKITDHRRGFIGSNRLRPAPSNPSTAAFWLTSGTDEAAVLRGGDLVGSLGWGFAAGSYLVQEPVANATAADLDRYFDAFLPRSVSRQAVEPSGHSIVTATFSGPDTDGIAPPVQDLAGFLVRLGDAHVMRDRAKLLALVDADIAQAGEATWSLPHGIVNLEAMAERADATGTLLKEWETRQQDLDETGTGALTEAKHIREAVRVLSVKLTERAAAPART